MATGIIADVVLINGLPGNGAVVNAYKASRFGGTPAEGAAAPGGGPDADPVTCGPTWGAEGAFKIVVPTQEPYYVGATYSGLTAWMYYSDTLLTPGSGTLDSTSTDITNSAPGDTRTAGIIGLGADAGHKHGREAFASPASLSFGAGTSAGSAATIPRSDHVHGMPADPTGSSLQLTGTIGKYRLVGTTAGGAPTSGTFQLNDLVADTAVLRICTAAGTPGTWSQLNGGVLTITAGTNVTIGGSPTNPIINAAESGVTIPTGWIAENMPRWPGVSANTNAPLTSGQTSYYTIVLPVGITVAKIGFVCGTVGCTTATHQFFSLMDNNMNALAATADGTTATWTATSVVSMNMGFAYSGSWGAASSFVTTYSGIYYLGVMVNASGTLPNFVGAPENAFIGQLAPSLYGNDSTHTGITTPSTSPAVGVLGATGLNGIQYCLVG